MRSGRSWSADLAGGNGFAMGVAPSRRPFQNPLATQQFKQPRMARRADSGFAMGVDGSHVAFRGFLPRKTTPRDLYGTTVIAKPL